jgi:hypothetical protein
MERRLEREVLAKISAGSSLASAPPETRALIARHIQIAFPGKRFTFIQLLRQAALIPELAWWTSFPEAKALERLAPQPADDTGLFRPERAIAHTEAEAAEMAVDAVLRSGLWEIDTPRWETDGAVHLVFAPTGSMRRTESAPREDTRNAD